MVSFPASHLSFPPIPSCFFVENGVYYSNMRVSFHFSGHKISTGFPWVFSMGDSKR